MTWPKSVQCKGKGAMIKGRKCDVVPRFRTTRKLNGKILCLDIGWHNALMQVTWCPNSKTWCPDAGWRDIVCKVTKDKHGVHCINVKFNGDLEKIAKWWPRRVHESVLDVIGQLCIKNEAKSWMRKFDNHKACKLETWSPIHHQPTEINQCKPHNI